MLVSFGTYNPKTLINNPPAITNYPFYEYLVENKMDFEHGKLGVIGNLCAEEKTKDTCMSGLLFLSLGAAGIAVFKAKNRIKAGFVRMKEYFKNPKK